ncbi:MAG: 4-hydroxy-3-methylbut-2-enyl diphosphate reductase [Patescibacteria group bacterium]
MAKKILFAQKYGFCFGVKRAVEALEKNKGKAYTLGPIIHNPLLVKAYKNRGIFPINDLDKIPPGTKVYIRAHGVANKIIKKGVKAGIDFVDLTCPFVKKSQILAHSLENKGYKVVIIGKKNHPEIMAIAGNLKSPMVISGLKEIKKIKNIKRLGIVCQTTSNIEKTAEIVTTIKKINPSAVIFNTVCQATKERQAAAVTLAKKTDLVIVVGGKNSSNTKKLKEICSNYTPTYQIEDEKSLKEKWFTNKKIIGLTAGASTPDWIIRKVFDIIKKLPN